MMRERLQLLLTIVRTRALLICVTSLCVTALLVLTYRPKPGPHTATATFWIGEAPLASARESDEERYFNWVTSEYLTTALGSWAEGGEFMSQVRWRLWLEGERFSLIELDAMIQSSVSRSGLRFDVRHVDEATAVMVANAVAAAFETAENVALTQLDKSQAQVSRLDNIVLSEPPAATVRDQLELPLRIAFGLLSGLVLAVLLQRPSRTIHDRRAVQQLDLALVGEIPE